METKKLAIRGVAVTWFGRIVGLAVTFFVTPILVHGLGEATYGIWSILMTLTGYYGLVDLGIGKAITKHISQYEAEGDDDSARKVMATSLQAYAIMALGIIALSALVGWCFPAFFQTAGHANVIIFWVVLLTGLKVSVQLLGTAFRSAINGRKRFDITNLLGIASQIVLAASIVWIVRVGGGLLEMAVAALAVSALTFGGLYLVARCWVRLPRGSRGDADRQTRAALFRFGSLTVLRKLAKQFGVYSGGIIIGVFLGPAAVAYYAVAESLLRKCETFGKAVNQVTMPIASQFDAEKYRGGLVQLLVLAPRLLLAMAFCFATIFCILGHSFISYWIAPDFAVRSYPVVCVLCIALLVRLPGNGIQSALEGMGRVGFLGRLAVVEATAVVLLAVAFVPTLGIVGMAWAILLPELVIGGLIIPPYACKVLKCSIARYFSEVVLLAALSAVPGLIVAFGAVKLFPAGSLWQIVAQMCLVAAVGGISTFLICLDSATRAATLRALVPTYNPFRSTLSAAREPTDRG